MSNRDKMKGEVKARCDREFGVVLELVKQQYEQGFLDAWRRSQDIGPIYAMHIAVVEYIRDGVLRVGFYVVGREDTPSSPGDQAVSADRAN